MKITIDAFNMRGGGGVTHIIEILSALNPEEYGIDTIDLWAVDNTLDQVPDKPWLNKRHHPLMEENYIQRIRWQRQVLGPSLKDSALLYNTGGAYSGDFQPFVTMSRNLMPFDKPENRRYGLSKTRWLNEIRELANIRTYRRAQGMIFLTDYNRDVVLKRMGSPKGESRVIYHGIADRFFREPRVQAPLETYGPNWPFRLLYVSNIDLYKHQWHVVEAVRRLKSRGLPVFLDVVGKTGNARAQALLNESMALANTNGQCVKWHGLVPYETLERLYHNADAFVFASTCETFGMVLLESMAAGLPVLAAKRATAPEILGNAGMWFEPESPESIEQSIEIAMRDVKARERMAWSAYQRAREFSWDRCARETFGFIREVADRHSG